MLFGALTKEMESTSLSSPEFILPYFGQTFDAVCDTARTIDSETWFHSSHDRHGCILNTAVGTIVDSAIANVEGLRLRDT